MPQRAVTALLAVASTAHWLLFFNAGQFDMTTSDWPRASAYLGVLRSALAGFRLPLETREPIYDMGSWYLGNLEAPLSPHLWLLTLFGDHAAVMASAIVMSWLGVYGCARLARRLGLGPPAFAFMGLVLCFHGGLVAHVGVGHLGWLGFYLVPFVAEALLAIGSSRQFAGGRAPMALAIVLFAQLLLGALHVALMCALLAALTALMSREARRPLARALAAFALLSAFRTVPAALMFLGGGRTWIADGYTSIGQAVEALLFVRAPAALVETGTTLTRGVRGSTVLNWIEFDAYIGIVGTAMLAIFGVAASARAWLPRAAREEALAMWRLPLLALAMLACWQVYAAVVVAPVSLLTVVRVPSRFMGLVVCMAAVIAAARFDAWWRSRHRDAGATALGWLAIAALAAQLAYHSYVQSPVHAGRFPVTLQILTPELVPLASTRYAIALAVGGITTAAALVWAGRSLMPRRAR